MKQPAIYTKDKFSFYASSVTLGSATVFSIGHTALTTDATFALKFDHDITASGASCIQGTTDVMHCSVSVNKRTLTCTKNGVSTVAPCSLSLTFAEDFAHDITVTSAFTGLPEGVVFHPTFKIKTSAPASMTPSSPTNAGEDMSISYTLPRIPLRTDVLEITAVDDRAGRIEFVRFEPNDADTSGAATIQDGKMYISLAALDTTKATKSNLRVFLRHVSKVDAAGSSSQVTLESFMNGGAAFASANIEFATNPLRLTAMPSAASAVHSVVAIKHPDMAINDSFTINDITIPNGITMQLRCGNAGADISPDNTGKTFKLVAASPASETCYLLLSEYTLTTPRWSVSATIGGTTRTVYTIAATKALAMPVVTPVGLAVDRTKTITLTIPDFTSAFAGIDPAVSFSYGTSYMTLTSVQCTTTTDVTKSGTINNGQVMINFAVDDVPLSSYGPLVCDVTLKPLFVMASPDFISVSVFTKGLQPIALPPFKAQYASSVTMDFPTHPILKDSSVTDVVIILDQIDVSVGATIAFTFQGLNAVGCGNAIVNEDGNEITLEDVSGKVICTFIPTYVSETSFNADINYTPAGGASTTYTVVLPPVFETGISIEKIAQTADTVTYRATLTSDSQTESYSAKLQSVYLSPGVGFSSACATQVTPSQLQLAFLVPQGQVRAYCDVVISFASAYEPNVWDELLTLTVGNAEALLPAVKTTTPTVLAGMSIRRVTFAFVNADAQTVKIDNIWDVDTTTAPVKVFSVADDAEVGDAVTSADGRFLTVSFKNGVVIQENSRYHLAPCYLDFTAIRSSALQATSFVATFTVGTASTATAYDGIFYNVFPAEVDPILSLDSKYEVLIQMALAGNQANLVLDYTKTALASVDKCSAATDDSTRDFSIPIEFTTKDSSISFALSQTNTFKTKNGPRIRLKCVFNTLSTAAAAKKVGTYARMMHLSIKSVFGREFFAAPVSVAIPFTAHSAAVTHKLSFTRSTLMEAEDLVSVALKYAVGLRKTVSALVDSQVVISAQKLVEIAVKGGDTVPSPITTQFVINAENLLQVTFTVMSTSAAPVTTANIDAAVADILAELSAFNVSADTSTAVETLVDGECATRCGLGCALCLPGENCTLDVDCAGGVCATSGVCDGEIPEPPEPPGNAAPAATFSIALLAALVAALLIN